MDQSDIITLIVNKILIKKNSQRDYASETSSQIAEHKESLDFQAISEIITRLKNDPNVIKAIIGCNCLKPNELIVLLQESNFNYTFVDHAFDKLEDSSILTRLFLLVYKKRPREAGQLLRKAKRHIKVSDTMIIMTETCADPNICHIL